MWWKITTCKQIILLWICYADRKMRKKGNSLKFRLKLTMLNSSFCCYSIIETYVLLSINQSIIPNLLIFERKSKCMNSLLNSSRERQNGIKLSMLYVLELEKKKFCFELQVSMTDRHSPSLFIIKFQTEIWRVSLRNPRKEISVLCSPQRTFWWLELKSIHSFKNSISRTET